MGGPRAVGYGSHRLEPALSLCVLIPARDEGPRLGATLEGVRAALPGARVFVVDGGSRDDTRAVAERGGAEVVAQRGRGYAGALASGYRRAVAAGCARLVQLDADGQHPPDAAPRLLAALDRADLVVGSRAGTDSPGSLGRRVGNAALAAAVRAATGTGLRDVTSGYQALGPRALAAFAASFPEDVADANVRVLAARRGLVLAEVPVAMPARAGGTSMHDGVQGVLNFVNSLGAAVRAARGAPPAAAEARGA